MFKTQKVALVTGASRGIGAAIAKHLATQGYHLVINYVGNKEAANAVVADIQQLGAQAIAVQANVAKPQAVLDLFTQSIAQFGRLDAVVNNAGILQLCPIERLEDQHINEQIDINLKGTLYMLKEAARHLQEGASIVNFSTSVVGLKLENYAVYAATKAAIEVVTGIMAKELRGRNIRVNAVAPGPTGTDLFLQGKSQAQRDSLAKLSPLERLGTPDDIAAVVGFLLSDASHWVNGQVIRANGGLI